MESREVLRFREKVQPTIKDTQRFKVPQNCTIERVIIRFYSGPQSDLRVNPYVEHFDEIIGNCIQYVNKNYPYIDGDNDIFEYKISKHAFKNEYICVDYENINSTYAYDMIVDIEVDYLKGVERVI